LELALPLLRSSSGPVPVAVVIKRPSRVLVPANTRIAEPLMVVVPKDELPPVVNVPALTVTLPVRVNPPPKVRFPMPALISEELPDALPPKVSVLAETVKVGLPEIARDDVPMLRLLPPVNVKEPVTEPAPALVSTLALPEELFSVPPAIVSVPPPRAPAEFRFRVPVVIDRPVPKVLVPERVSVPATNEAEAKPLSPLNVAVPELTVTAPPMDGLLPEAVSVPPLSVKAPLIVFAPDRVSVAEVPMSDVRVLLPVITKVVPEAAVTAPIVPPVPIFRAPAFKATAPPMVRAPVTVRVPAPALVRS